MSSMKRALHSAFEKKLTLNETLTDAGFRTTDGPGLYQKTIWKGEKKVFVGTARDVWAWLKKEEKSNG